MKRVFVVLATMPFTFSACKPSRPDSPEMMQPAMHAAMAGGSTMAAHAVAPASAVMAHAPATAPAMVPAAMAPATTMGATSKPTMKTAGGKRPVAGTRL